MIYFDWIELLQEFNELAGHNWKITLNRLIRGKDTSTDLKIAFKKLIIGIKCMLLKNDPDEIQELELLIDNEILYKLLMRYEEKVTVLSCYAAKLGLLFLPPKNALGEQLIEDIFKNVAVQNDTSFYQKFSDYGFSSEAEFQETAGLLDTIIMSAVKNRLGHSAVHTFLEEKFPDETELVEKISEQYTLYYNELRERYLIELNETPRP